MNSNALFISLERDENTYNFAFCFRSLINSGCSVSLFWRVIVSVIFRHAYGIVRVVIVLIFLSFLIMQYFHQPTGTNFYLQSADRRQVWRAVLPDGCSPVSCVEFNYPDLI